MHHTLRLGVPALLAAAELSPPGGAAGFPLDDEGNGASRAAFGLATLISCISFKEAKASNLPHSKG